MFVIIAKGYADTPVDRLPELSYDIGEAFLPREDTPCYVTVSAADKFGNSVSVTTNRSGEGLFERMPDGSYRQLAGTLQYRLPDSETGVRSMLRRKWVQAYTMDYYMYMAWLDIEACEAEEYYAD